MSNGLKCPEDDHRLFVFSKVVTDSPKTFHAFSICTRCGHDVHLTYSITGEVLWESTPDAIKES